MSDDGGGGLASPSEVEQAIAASMANIGIVITSELDIPPEATVRPSGVFTDEVDARIYLEEGGLVVTDDLGNNSPIGFVYLLEQFDEILWEMTWTVYVDENTNP